MLPYVPLTHRGPFLGYRRQQALDLWQLEQHGHVLEDIGTTPLAGAAASESLSCPAHGCCGTGTNPCTAEGTVLMARVAAEADSARNAIIRAAGPAAEEATAQLPKPVLQMLREHSAFLDTQGAECSHRHITRPCLCQHCRLHHLRQWLCRCCSAGFSSVSAISMVACCCA